MLTRATATKAEAQIAAAWAALLAASGGAVRRDGRYPQIGRSHSSTPTDGIDAVADLRSSKTSSRNAADPTWQSLGVSSSCVSMRVDEYFCPNGHGVSLVATIIEGGRRYVHTTHTGPERWRAHDWREESSP